MTSKQRLMQIERQLDSMNPDSPEYAVLDVEANQLAEELAVVEDAYRAQEVAKAMELTKKVNDIRSLVDSGETDKLIDKYGHEFINDYTVTGNTVFSKVTPDHMDNSWEVEEPLKKVRQLVYYRIYDTYFRARSK